MTTREPGASDVLTHGLLERPRSTAFLASSPAASITWGFDVLVQLVMAAMATWPWSRSNERPYAVVTGTRRWGRSAEGAAPSRPAGSSPRSGLPLTPPPSPGGSLAGNDSATASSWLLGG